MTPGIGVAANSDKLDLVLSSIGEIKQMIGQIDARVRALENTTITQGITAAQELKAAFRKLDEHASEIDRIKAHIDERVNERKIVTDGLDKCIDDQNIRLKAVEGIINTLRWIGGLFGALIVALIWAILTHQVDLIFH